MLVTDRYSGFCWDFYMKDKSGETLISAPKHLFCLFEYQYGFKPKVIETRARHRTNLPNERPFGKYYQRTKVYSLNIERMRPYSRLFAFVRFVRVRSI